MNTIYKYTIAIAVSLCAATAVAEPADSTAQDVNELKEVVVEGRRVEQIKDGINIRPTKLEKDASFSGWNLLEVMQPPTLIYNPKDESFKDVNNNPVSYYINMEPASKQDVDNLPTSLIISVQILQHPSDPKYAGSASVVNIVAKEYDYGGYTILSASEKFRGGLTRGSVFSKFQRKNWILQFNGYMFAIDKPWSTTDTRTIYNFVENGTSIEIERDSHSMSLENKYLKFDGQIKSTLRFGEEQCNRLIVTLTGSHTDGPKSRSEGMVDYVQNDDKSPTVNISDGMSTAPGLYMNLSFRNKENTKNFIIFGGVSGGFNNNRFGYNSDFTDKLDTEVKERILKPNLGFAYYRDVNNNQFYVDLSNEFTRAIADYTGSTMTKTATTLGKNNVNLNYGRAITDKFRFTLLTRNGLLYYNADDNKTNYRYDYNYALNLQWRTSDKSSTSLTGRIYQDMLSVMFLNPATRKTDELLEVSGNPDITPSVISEISANYSIYPSSKFNISAQLEWERKGNLITADYRYNDGYVLSTYANSGDLNTYRFNIIGTAGLLNRKLSLSFALFNEYYNRSGSTQYHFGSVSGWIFANYMPISGLKFSANISAPAFRSPRDNGYSKSRLWQGWIGVSFTYRNWYFNVQTDPFTKYHDMRSIEFSPHHHSYTFTRDASSRSYDSVSARFSFSYGKKMDMIEEGLNESETITGVR